MYEIKVEFIEKKLECEDTWKRIKPEDIVGLSKALQSRYKSSPLLIITNQSTQQVLFKRDSR